VIENYVVTTTPVVGIKTVTATAAEIFAGASALSGRKLLAIKNTDHALRIRFGSNAISQTSGHILEPLATVEIPFETLVPVPIYAISEGASVTVEVWESK